MTPNDSAASPDGVRNRFAGWLLRWATVGVVVATGWGLGWGCRPGPGSGPRAQGPLSQDAYVWQREWSPAVVRAVRERAGKFGSLVLLGGEIRWTEGRGEWTGVAMDGAALREVGRPIGVALRIGSFSGPFRAGDAAGGYVRRKAREVVETLRGLRVEPAELQVDFDAAESRLAGYRVWVEALRTDLAPLPVVITALPSWLGSRDFDGLARAASGFVLQVHSVARPRGIGDRFELCDPVAARRAVETAARVGVPFRVALPTYRYLVAFGTNGHYLGASAEGPPPARPPGTQLREVGADPIPLAQLVAEWTADRPAALRGLIWYRLPVEGDRLNWRWPTLEAVMNGRGPTARLVFVARHPSPGLVEIELTNAGEADHGAGAGIRVRWKGARLVARDGIRGFAAEIPAADEILFTNAICRLPTGEGRTIGWLRFDAEPSVELIP